MSETYFQKGFGLKASIEPVVKENYRSAVVERLKELGYDAAAGDLRVKFAREFGFCYGVDRAVQYAYETRQQFPDRPLQFWALRLRSVRSQNRQSGRPHVAIVLRLAHATRAEARH